MVEKKARWKAFLLDKYKLRIPIISNIHISDFEHDDIRFISGKKKGEIDFFEFSFEDTTPQPFESQIVSKNRKKIAMLRDVTALFHDKGIKLGDEMRFRAQRQVDPTGKKFDSFVSGKFEVLLDEETLKNKIFPLYKKLNEVNPETIRCLTWFNTGLSEVDKISQFLAYWISLEAITPRNTERKIDNSSMPVSLDHINNAITELKKIKDNDMKSRIIQKVKEISKYMSISEAMAERIEIIIPKKEEQTQLLSIVGKRTLKQALIMLSFDRANIAHGNQRDVEHLREKTIFLHDLIHEVLRKLLL